MWSYSIRASTYAIIIGIIVSILEFYLFSSNELHSTLAVVLFLGSIVTIPLALYFKKRSFITLITTYAQLTTVCTVFWVFSVGHFYSYMAAIGMSAASNCIFHTVVRYLFSFVVGFVNIFRSRIPAFSRACTPNLIPSNYRAHHWSYSSRNFES